MKGKVPKHRWVDRRKIVIFGIILIFLTASVIIFLSNKSIESSSKIVYVAANGSGDFKCDGIDDQVEINKALAYVAENPQFKTVYLRPPVHISSRIVFLSEVIPFLKEIPLLWLSLKIKQDGK